MKEAREFKIAFLNPYLQGGHTQTAEIETTRRLIEAARNLSITVLTCQSTDEVDAFDPDCVVTISYQVPKLTRYPTYCLMDAPVSFVKDVPRFIRNILSYDGYMTISPFVTSWLKTLCRNAGKKCNIMYSGFSVPLTKFKPCNFQHAKAMYVGSNWDGLRHKKLFNILADGQYLQCFGPKSKWSDYPESLYGGEIPFDGTSLVDNYYQCGIGLCLGHPAFDQEGIPSSRTYEIAAASALPLCSDTEFNRSIYGDSALYINLNQSTAAVANEIIRSVKWIRDNPEMAENKAKKAHEIFCNKVSMEVFLNNLVDTHHDILKINHFTIEANASNTEKITYIIAINNNVESLPNLLFDLLDQNVSIENVIVISKEIGSDLALLLNRFEKLGLNIDQVVYNSEFENTALMDRINDVQSSLVGLLPANTRLSKNHTAVLLDAYRSSCTTLHGVYAPSLEVSSIIGLRENMRDDHNIVYASKSRLCHPDQFQDFYISGFLFSRDAVSKLHESKSNLLNICDKGKSEILQTLDSDKFYKVNEVTSSVIVDKFIHNGQAGFYADADHAIIVNENKDSMQTMIQELDACKKQLDKIYSSFPWRCYQLARKVFRKDILKKIYRISKRLTYNPGR